MTETEPAGGLRERKRLAAMQRIQAVALALFEEHGFTAVTVERIADAADVSPSSVYRYFGTKEQIVLWDEYDPVWVERIANDLPGKTLFDAMRHAVDALVSGAFGSDEALIRRRVTLMMEEPSIEASSALSSYRAAEAFGAALSARLGKEHGDLRVQLFSHAIVGAITGGIHHWYESGFTTPLQHIFEQGLASFENGFDLAD
ncbi:TetR/AcrR family transcriptional regulator [Demequina sp.]|uniref:TetR/AcrR family transcriptional regulator n=1 Tax=Demequina sp. TaxID=2050685 RepID=UPI0025BECE8B|nr:TetR/AcrR family transcriptional regulator [Demequina sp.]